MSDEFLFQDEEVPKRKGINKAKKGYSKEKMARDQLKAEGWFIVFKSIRYRFGCIDMANLFDLVAYRGQSRKFISCKHFGKSNNYLSHQEDIRKFKAEYGKEGESYELWLWSAARYVGRGKDKHWQEAQWKKIIL